MESELLCPVCGDLFADPVMLQCTHHICLAHVEKLSERGQVKCPICAESTMAVESALRVDRVLQVVVDVWREKQAGPKPGGEGTPRPPQPICGFCEEKPATRRCNTCVGILCSECEKTSHSKGYFRTHDIVDLALTGEPTGFEDCGKRMKCDEHVDEKLSFYCLDCRKPVCSHCLILGEHKGHQQTPMDQAFVTAKDTLNVWVEQLAERVSMAQTLLESLHNTELEVQRGAEAQRDVINSELDHLRELVETKRHQLLSKSAMEEKQKRAHLQGQVDRAEKIRHESTSLVSRSKELLSLPSEHAFLAVVLPLIQDIKKCASQAIDAAPQVSSSFRPLSSDAQVRSLGDLDLGHPRQPQPMVVQAGQPAILQQRQVSMVASDGATTVSPGYSVFPPNYSSAHATMSYLPQQPSQQGQMSGANGVPAQSVYVYRSVVP